MNDNRLLHTMHAFAPERARLRSNRRPLRASGAAALARLGIVALCNSGVLAAPAIYVNGAPAIYVNGAPASVTAIVRNNQVFVPLHGVFEKLDTTVSVTPARTVVAHKAGSDIARLTLAGRQATVNGTTRTLQTPPFMSGATVFVPVRLISEAGGASVLYSAATHAINIKSASTAAAATVASAAPVAAATTSDAVAVVAPVAQQNGIPWWAWLLLALVALALLFAFLRRRKPEPLITTRSASSDPIIKTRR
jgi:hypothetical protein